jgi:hypothetical protein
VQAKMVESNNGTHQAFYCFLAEPAMVTPSRSGSGTRRKAAVRPSRKAATLQSTRQRQWSTRTPSRSSPMAGAPTSQP